MKRKHCCRFLWVVVILVICCADLHAQQDASTIVKLGEELWYYDTKASAFVPSFESAKPDPHFLGFYIGLREDEGKILRICGPEETTVWVQNRLMAGSLGGACAEIDVAIWREQFAADSVFVTLHSQLPLPGQTSVEIVSAGYLTVSDNTIEPVSRPANPQRQFLIIFALIFLGIMSAYRRQFPRIFKSFLDLNRMMSFRSRDDLVTSFRLLSTPSIVSHVLVSLISGFFLCIFYLENAKAPGSHFSLADYFERWLVFSSLMLAFFLGKRLLIQIFGNVFRLSGAIYLQVFEYLRAGFLLLCIGLCVLLPLFYLNSGVSGWFLGKLPVFAALFTVLVILLLFYKLAFETPYQKLHLFSYLCATETVPAILLLKWVFF